MIVVLNNKSNLSKADFEKYQEELKTIKTNNKLILCPSFIHINTFNLSNISLGAQTVSNYGQGAYTGEISAEVLKQSNVEYVIIGHSERRQYQKESNQDISEKIKQALKNKITPILCIGEKEDEKEIMVREKALKNELTEAMNNLSVEEKKKIIIAYEPIWSIGTGLIPKNQDIIDVITYIKALLPNNKVLYGGSVNENNISELNKIKQIDGYLIGGLSLQTTRLKQFLANIKSVY